MKLSEKIQEALREQQEINLSDPTVQKRLAAQWGYVPAGAQPAPIIPEGWKLVPIEPTYEMLEAGEDTLIPTYTDTPVSVPFDVYRAMLAAAPEAKP